MKYIQVTLNKENWITVNYSLYSGLAMLPKDYSRCLHEIIANKNSLFQPGKNGSYYVPEDKIEALQQTTNITYDNIRSYGNRFHQERAIHSNDKYQDKKTSFFLIYNKTVKNTSKITAPCVLKHKKYTGYFDSQLTDELCKQLIIQDKQGSRTYNKNIYFQLRSKYARILFVLFSGSGNKLNNVRIDKFSFSVEKLRLLFNISDTYKNISAFKSRLNQTKKDFENIGVKFSYSYDYPNGNKKAKKMFFIEVDKEMAQYKPPRVGIENKQNLFNNISESTKYQISKILNCNNNQIANNLNTFSAYIQLFSDNQLLNFLNYKVRSNGYLKRPDIHKFGWIINALKGDITKEEQRIEKLKAEFQGYIDSNPVIKELSESSQKNTNFEDTS